MPIRSRIVAVSLSSILVAFLAACGSGAAARSPSRGALLEPAHGAKARFHHVFVVVMENEEYSSALSVPGYASLAHRYAYDSRSYAASHPSLPNYLALTAGSTFGRSSDCLTCYVAADNLGAELSASKVTWDAYFQSVSTPCYLGTSYGSYAAKHNPFRYYDDIRKSRGLCRHLLPFGDLSEVLRGRASAAPRFIWVTPNICDDGHSCPQALAASWLDGFVAEVTKSAAWKDHGVLFITWDEGNDADTSSISPTGHVSPSGGGGHILTVVVSPEVRGGTVIKRPLTPYGILATIEDNFGLPLLRDSRHWGAYSLDYLAR